MQSKKNINTFSALIFSLGALIGFVFIGYASWADFEASLFDPAQRSDGTLWSIHCPVIIAPNETGMIRATISNPTDKKTTRRVRAHVSAGYVTYMDEYSETLELAPGESHKLEWPLNAENAVWDRFVLVRVILFSSYPLPARTGTCGVEVVNLFGLPGGFITALACITSLLLMIGGIILREKTEIPATRRFLGPTNVMKALAGLETAGMLSVLAGFWAASGIITLGTILLSLVACAHFITYAK